MLYQLLTRALEQARKPAMFGLGSGELLFVLVLALIFIGPEKLPQLATSLGKMARQLKQATDEIKTSIKDEIKTDLKP